jgi:hypothetical protein
MSRLFAQICQALEAFAANRLTPALIGGLALAAHNVVRATQDVDFLVETVIRPIACMTSCSVSGTAASIAAQMQPITCAATKGSIFCMPTAPSHGS